MYRMIIINIYRVDNFSGRVFSNYIYLHMGNGLIC